MNVFRKRHSEGWLDKETYDAAVSIIMRRMELELLVLKREMKGLATLPIPIQVASKMKLNSQIDRAEKALEELEKRIIEEEE